MTWSHLPESNRRPFHYEYMKGDYLTRPFTYLP